MSAHCTAPGRRARAGAILYDSRTENNEAPMNDPLIPSRRRWMALFAAFTLTLAGCAASGGPSSSGTPKNIIILFADGVAGTQWDFGKYSSRVLRGQAFATTDVVFREGVLG